jgi:alpha-glucosidase (family GH31 glycosyl hydrolase)
MFRDISEYPVLAKQGAIVPMSTHYEHDNRLINDSNMNVIVFPGANNVFELYEDAGEYSDFENGKFIELLNVELNGEFNQNKRSVYIDGYLYMFGKNDFKVEIIDLDATANE